MRTSKSAPSKRFNLCILRVVQSCWHTFLELQKPKKHYPENILFENPQDFVEAGGISIAQKFKKMNNKYKYNLKEIYEEARGRPISARQWRTVYRQLSLDYLLEPEEAVYVAAWIRRVSPKVKLSHELVFAVREMRAVFPLDFSMTRRDLWSVTLSRLNPAPSIPTLYRWAADLGYNQNQNWGDPDNHWLNPEDIRLWILKIIAWKTQPHGNYQTNSRSDRHFGRSRSTKAAGAGN